MRSTGPPPEDTIAAVSTAAGRAGVAVVRVSGPAVPAIARALRLPGLPPRRAVLAALRDPESGEVVERGLVTRFVAPASYTGEEMLEIGCHGGALAPQLVLDAVCAAGARPAGPGEFTRRAFLNGRIDLVQAEATLDLIDARSPASHRAALFQIERGLSRRIEELRRGLIELEALLAYDIDFPEEDDGPVPPERIEAAAGGLAAGLEALLRTAPEGELLREGALTVIAGRPNVGKSSLFNALLGEERAIVTEIPGTTRDAIEALVSVEGYPFRLVDAAGLREPTGRVEAIGIEIARGYLARAELVLFCAEAGRAMDAEERSFLEMRPPERTIVVRTKADLVAVGVGGGEAGHGLSVSSETGEGMPVLRARLAEAAFAGLREAGAAPLVTRRRHRRGVDTARRELEAFRAARSAGHPAEIAATHLADAARALEEVLGAVTAEDVLEAVFRGFCVGK